MAMNPSMNGHGSDAWAWSWTHFDVDHRSPSYCRVTFDHPPVNAVTATTVAELAELVDLIEHDADLEVVVFASANPDVFLAPSDVANDPAWVDVLVRLARAPVVTIAAIRGRVGGAGSEFVMACDLRVASREHTVLELDGPRAEQHGYVDRLIADDDLDCEVDEMARRLASVDG